MPIHRTFSNLDSKLDAGLTERGKGYVILFIYFFFFSFLYTLLATYAFRSLLFGTP